MTHAAHTPLLVLGALLVATTPAHAAEIGVGTSYGVGTRVVNGGGGADDLLLRRLPSVDLHIDELVLRLYALDLLAELADDDVIIAADLFVGVHRAPVGGAWDGVVQPGVIVALGSRDTPFGDVTVVNASGGVRLGAESGDAAHVGAYVVPTLGIALFDGEAALTAGGRLEMSVWF